MLLPPISPYQPSCAVQPDPVPVANGSSALLPWLPVIHRHPLDD